MLYRNQRYSSGRFRLFLVEVASRISPVQVLDICPGSENAAVGTGWFEGNTSVGDRIDIT